MNSAKRVVLATGNPGKAKEFNEMLGAQFEIVLQTDLKLEPADETGSSFLENALLKARFASEQSGLPAIADDSGLEVLALDGAPGVHSARYAGEDASDAENNTKLLTALQAVAAAERAARFRCVVVYVRTADDPEPLITEGVWQGAIGFAERGAGGFGYDPLFVDTGLPSAEAVTDAVLASAKASAELSPDEKNARSHRGKAVRDLCIKMQDATV
jgi:XTP/dITP diphosphohydrolase